MNGNLDTKLVQNHHRLWLLLCFTFYEVNIKGIHSFEAKKRENGQNKEKARARDGANRNTLKLVWIQAASKNEINN